MNNSAIELRGSTTLNCNCIIYGSPEAEVDVKASCGRNYIKNFREKVNILIKILDINQLSQNTGINSLHVLLNSPLIQSLTHQSFLPTINQIVRSLKALPYPILRTP
jgi:hypothetical protein